LPQNDFPAKLRTEKGFILLMQVPLVDLHAQYQTQKAEIMAAIEEVMENTRLYQSPRVERFEHAFAKYCSCEYGVGVSSGTDAIVLALHACGIGPGDEVITVSNTCLATVRAIALVGASPVFVDIDPQTYTLDCQLLNPALTPHTRAVLPVHFYGHPVDMDPLLTFARSHQLVVIEDASQAHGATYKGKRVGSLGDIGCFSFYYSKSLGAFGEAGICVTSNKDLADKLKLLRDHGLHIYPDYQMVVGNIYMDELQAAVLDVKLSYLDHWNAQRSAHAQVYTEQLRGVVGAVPVAQGWATHVYCYYAVQVHNRDSFRAALEQEGIETAIHYPTPAHLEPACARYGYIRGMLPFTEAINERIVSLPMYPELTAKQIELVVQTVKKHLT
jgi:dTDP-4-amino-4,6-dideoxygalactose transaminase